MPIEYSEPASDAAIERLVSDYYKIIALEHLPYFKAKIKYLINTQPEIFDEVEKMELDFGVLQL